MKPAFHKIEGANRVLYNIDHRIQSNLGSLWHYHPEFELHYIIKGEGIRLIGDNINNFSDGEMILLGSNVPHTWRCNDVYFQNDQAKMAEVLVMHFLPESIGRNFLSIPEVAEINLLYKKARTGLIINGTTRRDVIKLMYRALKAEYLEKIIVFVSILKRLAESDEIASISTAPVYQPSEVSSLRLNDVLNYTYANYKRKITLDEIASVANLSVAFFCRYFRRMTQKSYHDFLVEIRISHACRLLVENRLSVEMICFECGFINLSNFYRHFKRVKGMTPQEYKGKYLFENIH